MKALERVLGLSAGLALFLMMGLTFVDVIARKLLASSVPGGVEVTELLMLAVIFLALPLTALHGEHVIFDLLDRFLPPTLRSVQHRIANVACALMSGAAAWLVLRRALRAAEDGDRTAQLGIPLDVVFHVTAVLLLAGALVHVVLAARASPDSDTFHPAGTENDDA